MRLYQFLLLTIILLGCLTWLSGSSFWKKTMAVHSTKRPAGYPARETEPDALKGKAVDARVFIKQKGYNEDLCFLINMSLPSGQNRFFVYDLEKDTSINAGLVTHGRCNEYWLEGRKYGNAIGCGCTSLGKYRIGYPYTGRFGLAYKLHGLDKTNDNAFSRFVVLHSHECVPGAEITEDICQSDGCPTVSPGFLQYLKPILDASKKPVLLWIYQ
jgi:hypothetical protein